MIFNKENVLTSVNAEEAELNVFGYFSNDIESLQQSVEEERNNHRCLYARLDCVIERSRERRFGNNLGYFSLFYPLDDLYKEERV